MESLLAHLGRKYRGRLDIVRVDIDESPEMAKKFRVRNVPTLVLVKGRRTIGRFEGRAKAAELEQLVEPHVPVDRRVG
jgi:thioredoxin-like negative regulator of GroEL